MNKDQEKINEIFNRSITGNNVNLDEEERINPEIKALRYQLNISIAIVQKLRYQLNILTAIVQKLTGIGGYTDCGRELDLDSCESCKSYLDCKRSYEINDLWQDMNKIS